MTKAAIAILPSGELQLWCVGVIDTAITGMHLSSPRPGLLALKGVRPLRSDDDYAPLVAAEYERLGRPAVIAVDLLELRPRIWSRELSDLVLSGSSMKVLCLSPELDVRAGYLVHVETREETEARSALYSDAAIDDDDFDEKDDAPCSLPHATQPSPPAAPRSLMGMIMRLFS